MKRRSTSLDLFHPDPDPSTKRTRARPHEPRETEEEVEQRIWASLTKFEDFFPLTNVLRVGQSEMAALNNTLLWVRQHERDLRQLVATMKRWVDKYRRNGRGGAATMLERRIAEAYETIGQINDVSRRIAIKKLELIKELVAQHG